MNWNNHWRVSENKTLEMQFDWWSWPYGGRLASWLNFEIDIDITGHDHAGASLGFTLLRLFHFRVDFYDNRHWNEDKGEWEKYDEE